MLKLDSSPMMRLLYNWSSSFFKRRLEAMTILILALVTQNFVGLHGKTLGCSHLIRWQTNHMMSSRTWIIYKLHDVGTEVAESLDGLASQTGDSEEKAIESLESSIEWIGMGLKHIRAIPCPTNNETVLRLEMLERYEGILRGIKQAKETIQNRKSPHTKAYVFNNCKLLTALPAFIDLLWCRQNITLKHR